MCIFSLYCIFIPKVVFNVKGSLEKLCFELHCILCFIIGLFMLVVSQHGPTDSGCLWHSAAYYGKNLLDAFSVPFGSMVVLHTDAVFTPQPWLSQAFCSL